MRRRTVRFIPTRAWEGELSVFHDVTIRSSSAGGLWVTAAHRLPTDGVLALEPGDEDAHEVRLAQAMPTMDGGLIRHCLRLDAVSVLPDGQPWAKAGSEVVLAHRIRVRMVEMSRGGCRLETASAVAAGMLGRLVVTVPGERFVDAVRVVWCRTVEGSGSALMGVEIFPAGRARAEIGAASIRDALSRVAAAAGAD